MKTEFNFKSLAPWHLCALVVFLRVFTASAQNFAIIDSVISAGGGTSTNGSYEITGTISQVDASPLMSGGGYSAEGGFWSIVVAIQTPGAPLLKVKRVGSTLAISWTTTDTSGFVLEQTGSLSGTINWSSVVTTPTVVNNENVVTVSDSSGFHFYRLRKP